MDHQGAEVAFLARGFPLKLSQEGLIFLVGIDFFEDLKAVVLVPNSGLSVV